jgi:hypothetical protein
MKNNKAIAFPLTRTPTHYVACNSNPELSECSHVTIKLTWLTLFHLIVMSLAAGVLSLIGIKITIFETKARTLKIACLRYVGKQTLQANHDTSTDEAPYDCLSLGELAALGGYATEEVLLKHFAPTKKELKIQSVEVQIQRWMIGLKVYFTGPNPSIEADPFNLGIVVRDVVSRSVQQLPKK